jgi:hypothetical protein
MDLIMVEAKILKIMIIKNINQASACALAVALGLTTFTSCSNDESLSELTNLSQISFKVEVPTTCTRAYWDYADTYTAGATLPFNWNDNDTKIAVYQGSGVIEGLLDFSSTTAKVKFTAVKSAMTYLLFPYSNDISKLTIAASHTQDGKTTTHLSNEMYMGAAVNLSELSENSTVTLSHLPAVLRFILTNKRGETISNPTITVDGKFLLGASIETKQDDDKLGDHYAYAYDAEAKTISVGSTNVSLNTNDKIALYALTFPTATEDTNYTFKVTVGDKTYTSDIVLGDNIKDKQFKGGYYYTFKLLLDDQLTVTSTSVSENPFSEGWNDETAL